MRKLKLYRTLGLSRGMRRLRMRDNILRNAEQLHEKGLDSRIPFLKIAFETGETIAAASTAKRELGPSVPKLNEGPIDYTEGYSFEQLMRFNIFNVESNLQVLPYFQRGDWERNGQVDLRVFRCKTTYIGDLRVSYVPKSYFKNVQSDDFRGIFINHIFEVIIDEDCSGYEKIILIHELEHAKHISLSYMAGLPSNFIPLWRAEYLSMFKQLEETGNTFLVELITDGKQQNLDKVPHFWASCYFVYGLFRHHGLGMRDIKLATEAYWSSEETWKNHPGYPVFKKMHKFGREEYERMYALLFGLPLDDIREIIDSLPMM